MERVQFQQEQMLAELKDLEQKGIFSQEEIKHIVKKRTAFETTLVRRIPRRVDFMRYVAYEMGLEALRSKRVKRLKIPRGPPSASDYALIRRQFQIFERALRKFPDDVSLWVQYIRTAQRAHARALVSRICGRALSLHPDTPCLYVLAAAHELKHLSPSAARVLLQRGLRLNSESVLLWREYVKMELGFVEGLRRRWGVLGIKIEDEKKEEGERDKGDEEEGLMVEGLEEGEAAKGERGLAGPDADDEDARKEILNGVLVKTVISNAAKALPTLDLFLALHSVLSTYPCPPSYRHNLLDHLLSHLYSLLQSQRSASSSQSEIFAQCVRLYTTRYFMPPPGSKSEPEGEALVDAIQRTNEDLITLVCARRTDETAKLYVEIVKNWYEKDLDGNLNLYLLASLQNLCSSLSLPSLLSAHLSLLQAPQNPNPPSSPELLSLERRYNSKLPRLLAAS